jgi:hypothetical protein
MVHKGW